MRGSETAGWWVALLVDREWDGWIVGGAAGWDRVGRLDCWWRCWLRGSGTAGWWVAPLVGREWDGWMVGGAAGWDRVGDP